KANPHGGAGRAVDGRVHADEPARAVEQRPSRVTWVDGCIGLDDALDDPLRYRFDLAVQGAHNAARHGVVEAKRVADGEGTLADLEVVRRAQRQRPQAALRGVDPEHGQVAIWVLADQAGRPGRAVRQRHPGGVSILDDVVVRYHTPVRVPYEARA